MDGPGEEADASPVQAAHAEGDGHGRTTATSSLAIDLTESPEALQGVGVTELLDSDERPVLILDLNGVHRTTPIYHNKSYLELQAREHEISGIDPANDPKHTRFTRWTSAAAVDSAPSMALHWGFRWTIQTLRNRWRVVSGQPVPLLSAEAASTKSEAEEARITKSKSPRLLKLPEVIRKVTRQGVPIARPTPESQVEAFRAYREDTISLFPVAGEKGPVSLPKEPSSTSSLGPFDLTAAAELRLEVSGFVKFFLDFDWASTELGPISSWSTELRRGCNFLLADRRPAAMYWGENRIMMYNEGYVFVTGQKHPFMMGKPLRVAWAEILDDFGPVFDQVYATGVAAIQEDALVYIDRNGYREETYFSISIIPFSTGDGSAACYNPVFDTSRQIIADRRITFLLRLGQYIASSREPKDFWSQLLRGLQGNARDVPFALLYSAGCDVNETLSVSSEQSKDSQTWSLEGSVRVPENCLNIPMRLNSNNPPETLLPNFHHLVKAELPTLLRGRDGSLPPDLLRDLQGRGLEIGNDALFCPIRSTGDTVVGFLILGLNPHKQYDDDYKLFMQLLSRQLATSMAAAVLFEDEIKRGKMAAEMATVDRNRLSMQLAVQTHETIAVENRFRRMADLAPVGMFHMDAQGGLIYANDNWYNLTQHPRGVIAPMSWHNVVAEIDQPLMTAEWEKLSVQGLTVSFELRLKAPFHAPEMLEGEEVDGYTWIIVAAYPEKTSDGTVIGILGCLTDISRQKWAEGFQARKLKEAVELKRQQESFIDMTSHEMRNPLSAIIQCADFIASSLTEFSNASQDITSISQDVIESHIDAAQTIMHCGQHQKRIIDDILMLSKINSDLLSVTPVEVQPLVVIKNALKMFDGEVQRADIELRLQIEESYHDLSVDWVKLDPSRLLQVFINLTTNAIKFTKLEAKRRIVVNVSASLELPISKSGIEYLPRESDRKDLSLGSAWGSGEMIYLSIEVTDTGRGLTEHERKLLFQRFSQASTRTHVEYGGSGLGLFISRELTELQGGQIGVFSEAGVGSTFAFFVRARRCTPAPGTTTAPVVIDTQAQPNATYNTVLMMKPNEGSRRPSPVPATAIAGPKHVLVVEDNIVNQKVLSKQLCSAGCIVYVANHGGEAISFLESSEFWQGNVGCDPLPNFICLMDLEMPVMDGLTCVKRIRELQQEGKIIVHIPIIAVTANARSEQIAVAKEAGMDGVVTKPFRIPELIPEMEKLLKAWSTDQKTASTPA